MKHTILTIDIPSTAADTEDEWYVAMPAKGKWRIIAAYWAPATAVAANDTNYRVLTLAKNTTAAPTTFTDIGNVSTASVADVIGTSRAVTLSGGEALEINQGEQIRVAKTDPGTGALAHGSFAIHLEKIN